MATMLYGALAYVVFLVSFLYAVGFVGNVVVPKSIDSGGGSAALFPALAIDALLLGLFAIQHSVMARPAFKRWWTGIVPRAVERSTYVLVSSLLLLLLFWQWQPIGTMIWSVGGAAQSPLVGGFWLGWLIVLLSTFMISHFELFGLRQAYAAMLGKAETRPEFRRAFLYKLVRHPIMLGFLIAFWTTPSMTLGHLIFALATTGYILIGVQLEERDLIAAHGETYRTYKKEVSMLLPIPKSAAR